MSVLVTGAAGGIGRAVRDALLQDHPSVVGQDLAAGDDAVQVPGDLSSSAVLDRVAEALVPGPLEVVVAAHGVAGAGALAAIGPDRARRVMEVNFESVVLLWERLRPALEEHRGVLVVVASQAGLVSEADNGVYSASKSALAGWLRGLQPLTPARLRLVHPGATRTPLLESALQGMAAARGVPYDDLLAERNRATPAGRLGEPSEIGRAVRWLTRLATPRLVELAITGGEVRH